MAGLLGSFFGTGGTEEERLRRQALWAGIGNMGQALAQNSAQPNARFGQAFSQSMGAFAPGYQGVYMADSQRKKDQQAQALQQLKMSQQIQAMQQAKADREAQEAFYKTLDPKEQAFARAHPSAYGKYLMDKMGRGQRLTDKAEELIFADRLRSHSDQNKARIEAGLPPLPFSSRGASQPVADTPSAQGPAQGQPTAQRPMTLPEAKARNAAMVAEQKAIGKARGEAMDALPGVEQDADYMISVLDRIVAPKVGPDGVPLRDEYGRLIPGKYHPGLPDMVGLKGWGGLPTMLPYVDNAIPGTDAADFKPLLDQVKGGQFMQAYQSLRGGGQITEIEGKKAEQAKARMDTAQSEEAFKEAVLEFRDEVARLVALAQQRAGQAPVSSPSKRMRWNPDTGKLEAVGGGLKDRVNSYD